jgi:hypothetical protein
MLYYVKNGYIMLKTVDVADTSSTTLANVMANLQVGN